jgi:hypothetical protein
MATVTGSVSQISIFSTFCCVSINKVGGGSETVLLWSYSPSQPDNATNRLLHANFLALTRDAYIHSKTIEVQHPDTSSLVSSVAIK